MGKSLTTGAVVLSLLAIPLLVVAMLVTVVATPAAGEEYRTTHCTLPGGPLPPNGDWRPPYQQTYALTDGNTYGWRTHPITGLPQFHTGTDMFSIPTGGPIVAVAAGRVTRAAAWGTYGNVVDVTHEGGVLTRYAHLDSFAVQVGEQVYSGQQLGTEGTTGRSTGNHLHLEIHVDGSHVDPAVFLAERGAPLNGLPVAPSPPPGQEADPDLPGDGEGGIGFELPEPGEPRQDSLVNEAVPVPADVQTLYEGAAAEYNLPWALLAGVGMAETAHGANTGQSPAGAQGLMQFMPATFETYGVDGDGDGVADIHNDADSVYSAANYLTASAVHGGEQGVRDALFAYNRADWYVNDVLYYAHEYGGGLVLAEPIDCPPGMGNPDLPPLTDERVRTMLEFAAAQAGDAYLLGATGPNVWDCSSLTQASMAQIGITSPRTAQAQRDWLAAGNGFQVSVDQAQPGDLFFYDSYLGPNQIGHVGFVWDPGTYRSIEALNPTKGVGFFDYEHALDNNIFQVWRIGSIADQPNQPPPVPAVTPAPVG
ncbi:peptidoglycan DD-metalloendopeptidase family protein [Ornithinimicrobium panacihumi]|uniref:peptidoglycan DD-metalloendopeptidase family protein n=1 Tax=Ornithinimicrobium panacihumi TaxID=2008449 RepID=UPI003F8A26D8